MAPVGGDSCCGRVAVDTGGCSDGRGGGSDSCTAAGGVAQGRVAATHTCAHDRGKDEESLRCVFMERAKRAIQVGKEARETAGLCVADASPLDRPSCSSRRRNLDRGVDRGAPLSKSHRAMPHA